MRHALIAALLLITPASGQEVEVYTNGNTLLDMCQSSRDLGAMGYILGAYDMNEVIEKTTGNELVCAPSKVQGTQVVDLVCKHLEDHPETRHQPAATAVFVATSDAWPCP